MIQEFTIERPHPDFRMPKRDREKDLARTPQFGLTKLLPITLEVEAEPRNMHYYYRCDCSVVYRLTPRSVRMLKAREVLRKGLNEDRRPCVCGCMGNLEA